VLFIAKCPHGLGQFGYRGVLDAVDRFAAAATGSAVMLTALAAFVIAGSGTTTSMALEVFRATIELQRFRQILKQADSFDVLWIPELRVLKNLTRGLDGQRLH
jgi:uncharacterized membrane protein